MFTLAVTERMLLQLPMDHDAEALFALIEANRDHIGRFINWADQLQSVADTRQYLQTARENYAQQNSVIVLVREDTAIIGMVMLYIRDAMARVAEIGYWLAESHSGRGLMTACVRVMLDYAFVTMGMNKVKARCATQNAASRAIPERLNMLHEARLRAEGLAGDRLYDLDVYSAFAADWPQPAQAPEFEMRVADDLALRLIEDRHAQTFFALTQHNYDHLRAWLGWLDKEDTVDRTRAFIAGALNQFVRNDGCQLGIWVEGELAGAIGYHGWDFTQKRTELGYWLSRDYTGRGLMSRASSALTSYAFATLGFNRVVICCARGNQASAAIPRRLGFQHEGTLRAAQWLYDHFVDHEIYAMLAADWPAQEKNNR